MSRFVKSCGRRSLRLALVVMFALSAYGGARFGARRTSALEVTLETTASGISAPAHMAAAPDGTGRLFVVNNTGLIRIVLDGEVIEQPFLDITDIVVSEHAESGLFSIEFHPDFAENGLRFLHLV